MRGMIKMLENKTDLSFVDRVYKSFYEVVEETKLFQFLSNVIYNLEPTVYSALAIMSMISF